MSRKKKSTEYTSEFRENAIRRTKLPGQTVASVAEEFNIPAWRLHNWIKEAKQKLERSSDLEEIVRLHNENKRLKEENEFLKKAAVYIANSKPSGSVSPCRQQASD